MFFSIRQCFLVIGERCVCVTQTPVRPSFAYPVKQMQREPSSFKFSLSISRNNMSSTLQKTFFLILRDTFDKEFKELFLQDIAKSFLSTTTKSLDCFKLNYSLEKIFSDTGVACQLVSTESKKLFKVNNNIT